MEQGLPAGGEAVLLVKVEHGLILWFWPWDRQTNIHTLFKKLCLVPTTSLVHAGIIGKVECLNIYT